MLICPKCGLPLSLKEKSACCENGHSFDRARQGYWNLLMDNSSHGHGDDKKMLQSRRSFLEGGYYEPLADQLSETVAELFPRRGVLLDAGCGEGYYTQKLDAALKKAGKEPSLYAFDIAKEAVRMTAGKLEKKGTFFVASTFHIPMKTASADVALSLFAPYSEEEFLRVLRPQGYLVRAVPLEDHLYRLKKAVYDHPVKNEKKAVIGEGFVLLSETELRGEIRLDSPEKIRTLFGMTPYEKKTGLRERARLESLSELLPFE